MALRSKCRDAAAVAGRATGITDSILTLMIIHFPVPLPLLICKQTVVEHGCTFCTHAIPYLCAVCAIFLR